MQTLHGNTVRAGKNDSWWYYVSSYFYIFYNNSQQRCLMDWLKLYFEQIEIWAHPVFTHSLSHYFEIKWWQQDNHFCMAPLKHTGNLKYGI